MTLPVTDRIAGPYSCNGVVDDFDFAFKVFTTADIRVVKTSAAGAETVLVLDSDYTVVLNADQQNDPGGTVTTGSAFATGFTITIDGALSYGQTAELTNLGPFFPKVIERALDRLAILIQQLKVLSNRSIKLPVSSIVSSELPEPQAGYAIGWGISGFANILLSTGTSLVSLIASGGSALVGFIHSGVGAVLRTAQGKLRDTYSVMDYGAVGDGVTDDRAAIVAALAAIPNGATLHFPATAANVYRVSSIINLTKTVHLRGGAWHEFALNTGYGTTLLFDGGDGIVINAHNTFGATTVANNTYLGANFTTIENLSVASANGSSGDGIWMRAVATVRNFCVRGFGGNGIKIVAHVGAGGATEGNANDWKLDNGRVLACGGKGVYVAGADANRGAAYDVYVANIGGIGFHEDSLLGNSYYNCSGQTVTGEFITANRATNFSKFDNPWYDGVNESTINFPSIVEGGGVSLTAASTARGSNGGIAKNAPYRYEARRGTTDVAIDVGVHDTTQSVLKIASEDEDAPLTTGQKLTYNTTTKLWGFTNFAGNTWMHFPNSLSQAAIPLPIYAPVFPNGLLTGAVAAPHATTWGTAAPVTGTWRVGDRRFNSVPAVGQPKSWVCTVAPGTWVSEGNL